MAPIAGFADEQLERWPGIMPGDIGWDEGGGFVGLAIRMLCLGAYAHCYVYVDELPNGNFLTVEAYPGGVKYRERDARTVNRVLRLWKTEEARQAIISEARSHVGKNYAYGELIAIALNRLGIGVSAPDRTDTMICSNSCARAALQGDIPVAAFLTRTPDRIWPARLERDLNVATWNHYIAGLADEDDDT